MHGKTIVAASCVSDNKIGVKLVSILNQLPRVRKIAENFTVYTVIVSPVEPESVVISELQDARNQGVAVLLRPDLIRVLDLVPTMSPDEAIPVMIRLLEERGAQLGDRPLFG